MGNMMINKNIVLYTLMTEKAVNLIESENKLTFIVNLKANKYQVKKTIEELYDVKIDKVNLLVTSKGLKKAYVTLKPEDKASDLAIRLGIF
jgi:large subunit ribosomal protein L23